MREPRALFEQWYPRLVRYLRAQTGDADQAEDIAQEAFVRLLAHDPANPRAWLFSVATNLATDAARKSTGRRRHLALIRADEQPGGDDAAAALVRAEEVDRVRRVLARLSERDRTLLLLHHEGLRYRDIADQLGVAPSSVGPLLTRAQRRFVERFESDDDDMRCARG